MSVRKLSAADKLVLAADSIDRETNKPFSAEDLVVRAWTLFNSTFGLRGHTNEQGKLSYPDSNRVFVEIMGSKPLRAKGLLEKTGNKTYRLTSAGRTLAEELRGVEEGATRRASLGRDELARLRRYLAARAVVKFREGRTDAISFTDACALWGISAGSGNRALEAKRSEMRGVVDRARAALNGAESAGVDNAGRLAYSAGQLSELETVDADLQERFAPELSLIRDRRDER